MRTYVLVHGAWGGSHSWRNFAPLLWRAGHEAFTPSLTGLGERTHLGSAATNLSTHIQDATSWNHDAETFQSRLRCYLRPRLRRYGCETRSSSSVGSERLITSRYSSAAPAPIATQSMGLSATWQGTLVCSEMSSSKPRSRSRRR